MSAIYYFLFPRSRLVVRGTLETIFIFLEGESTCSAVQCSAVQCSAVQCSAVQAQREEYKKDEMLAMIHALGSA